MSQIRTTLDAIKKESRLSKWAAVEDTVLTEQNLQRTILEFIPLTEEKVRNISNKVAVEKEVLNIDNASNGW